MMALVTGGASSGKSAYAEQLACALPGNRFYLAAMKPFGEEGARRIARHRALRAGKGFVTVECFDGLLGIEDDEALSMTHPHSGEARSRTALLESLGNVVANAQFADDGTCSTFDEALREVLVGIDHIAGLFDNLVIVGDEVGGDGIRYDETTQTYVELIGSAACAIAAKCDLVVECVASQPFVVKDVGGLYSRSGGYSNVAPLRCPER